MRIAVYPGTFDPVTNGHLDILRRAAMLFDKLIVAIAKENYKDNLFTTHERLELVNHEIKDLPNVEAMAFSGLLGDFVVSQGACAIVRGLRAMSDFDYEFQMSLMNKKLAPDVETVFLATTSEYLFLSSSIIKQVAAFGGDISGLVPENVEQALQKKFRKSP